MSLTLRNEGSHTSVKSQHSSPEDLNIEYIFDMVFAEDEGYTGHLSMVYESFLDDSKDAGQKRMIVSAGFCGTKAAWTPLRKLWKARLKQDGLEYFKTSEYKMLKEQFEVFRKFPPPIGRNKAKELRSDLQEIVALNQKIVGIGVAIPVEEYEQVANAPESKGLFGSNPYHRALESVIFQTVKYVRSLPGKNVVAFVHDDGTDFNELRDVYHAFKEKNPRTAKLMRGFIPLDDKLHPPLQLADMIANMTMELGLEWLENGRTQPKLKEMKENIKLLGIWEKSYVESVRDSNLEGMARAEERA
jgi:hypothetical protein